MVGLLALAMTFINVQPASAAALTGVTWAVSSNGTSDTAVRYSWSATAATAGTVTSVTFTVPTGTGVTGLTVGDVFGLGANGSVSGSGTTVTYTSSPSVTLAAGTSIFLSVDGFTNTTTAGAYNSSITTLNGGSAVDGPTATGTTTAISDNSTTATVTVNQALAFTATPASTALTVTARKQPDRRLHDNARCTDQCG